MTETLKKKRVDSFEIVLEHDIDEQYQYVPGEMMKGVLVVKCTEAIVVRELLVTLRGEGNVIWEEEKRGKKNSNKFRSKEIYLDYTENLAQSATAPSGVELTVGLNEFPFYYQLSENLPSSYIGKYGSVTYLVKAQLRPDRRYGADAMITNEPFLVLRRYDLSLEPAKLQPYEVNKTHNIGNQCLCGGKVTVFVKINRSGFVPGEDLRLNADVANGSSAEITMLQAALIMTASFHATKSTITSDQIISKHTDSYAVDKGEGRRWNDVRLTVPPYIPESALEGCDIIDLHYAVIFHIEFNYNPKHKDNLRILMPITIGTHGIRIDDDPAEDIAHRPLYQRVSAAHDIPIQIRADADDGDEMGEIDHSLFETSSRPQTSYQPKFTKRSTEVDRTEQDPSRPAPVINVLYGDLVSSSEMPDSNPDGTIRDNQAKSNRHNKKQAPPVPMTSPNREESSAEASEEDEMEQTRL